MRDYTRETGIERGRTVPQVTQLGLSPGAGGGV